MTGRRELLESVEVGYDRHLAVSPTGGPILFTKNMIEADLVMIDNLQ